MYRTLSILICAAVVGGCGGQYILTAPDQLAAAGLDVVVVVRLERQEFLMLTTSVEDAALRFRIGNGHEHAAYTDKLGYAGAMIPLPPGSGRYVVKVRYQDHEGDEFAGEVDIYACDAQKSLVAVDLDCLPPARGSQAAAALKALARKANILYLTRRPVQEHGRAHAELANRDYPSGPIVLWRRRRWHIVRKGRYRLPRLVVESRMVSQLPQLRQTFPAMDVGICDSPLAAKAFTDAGMQCVLIGPTGSAGETPAENKSWADLAEEGL